MSITSKLTSKAQTTVPLPVRRALGLQPGDELGYEILDGKVVLSNASRAEYQYLRALQETLSEWNDPANDIYNDL